MTLSDAGAILADKRASKKRKSAAASVLASGRGGRRSTTLPKRTDRKAPGYEITCSRAGRSLKVNRGKSAGTILSACSWDGRGPKRRKSSKRK